MNCTRNIFGAFVLAALFLTQPMHARAADAPALAGAEKVKQEASGDGTHGFYRSKKSAADLLKSYQGALEGAGWTVTSDGGEGSAWGGGGGLTATKGSAYLVMSAGGEAGNTNVDLCVWPSKPEDDGC